MNKRGQIYILAALILAVAFYILLTKTNIIFEKTIEDDFEELSKNYDLESAKFVNSLLQSGELDIESAFKQFTDKFTDYSERQNPDFGLIYIFNYKGILYVGNYLSSGDIFIKPEGASIYYPFCSCLEKCESKGNYWGFSFTTTQSCGETCCHGSIESNAKTAELVIDGVSYNIFITMDRPELVIIGSETREEQKKVYMRGDIPGSFAENFGNKFCQEITTASGTDVNIQKFGGGRCDGNSVNCGLFYKKKMGCIMDEKCCWDEVCKQKGECKE